VFLERARAPGPGVIAKAIVPERCSQIIDEAIQMHGAAEISQWLTLADMWHSQRTLGSPTAPPKSTTTWSGAPRRRAASRTPRLAPPATASSAQASAGLSPGDLARLGAADLGQRDAFATSCSTAIRHVTRFRGAFQSIR